MQALTACGKAKSAKPGEAGAQNAVSNRLPADFFALKSSSAKPERKFNLKFRIQLCFIQDGPQSRPASQIEILDLVKQEQSSSKASGFPGTCNGFAASGRNVSTCRFCRTVLNIYSNGNDSSRLCATGRDPLTTIRDLMHNLKFESDSEFKMA